MLFTEEEARQKACCSNAARMAGNKIARGLCLGSECMAWRWRDTNIKLDVDDLPISVLELSARAENALLNRHPACARRNLECIDTIGKLRRIMQSRDYATRAEFGKVSQNEVRRALQEFLSNAKSQRCGYCGLAGKPE